MAEIRLGLEPEVREILSLIDMGKNFLLSGGAGSGKTYSLVQVIRQLILEHPSAKIACMTYTNAAVREIEDRVNHKNLNVTTIHDFLWDNIKNFQQELKSTIISLANDSSVSEISIDDSNIPTDFFDNVTDGIQYKEFTRLREGIISHDELILIAHRMFKVHKKLCDILKDKFKFILVDEYQDTHKNVIELLITFLKISKKQNIVGFFGDAMQSIYEDGVGNLDVYKVKNGGSINEVKKTQNRRNPQSIIALANLLRSDGITQQPSSDVGAPNMNAGRVKQGTIKFLYSDHEDISKATEFLKNNFSWDFSNTKETKELNLTHNLIAGKAGFRTLMDIYDKDQILKFRDRIKAYIKEHSVKLDTTQLSFGEVVKSLQAGKSGRELAAVSPTAAMKSFIDENSPLFKYAESCKYSEFEKMYVNKDQLIDDKKQDESQVSKKGTKRDGLIQHLYKIEKNISLYINHNYNDFLRHTDYRDKIISIESKRILKASINNLVDVKGKTIEEIISLAHKTGICLIDDKLDGFKEKKSYIYNRVKDVPYSEFQALFEYLEGRTPFSTQHKTKGAEYDNILVILDNGNWNNYNFENLFTLAGSATVLDRTQKIFYVCCTRAKENLAVFYYKPQSAVIEKATEWFGNQNIINLDK